VHPPTLTRPNVKKSPIPERQRYLAKWLKLKEEGRPLVNDTCINIYIRSLQAEPPEAYKAQSIPGFKDVDLAKLLIE